MLECTKVAMSQGMINNKFFLLIKNLFMTRLDVIHDFQFHFFIVFVPLFWIKFSTFPSFLFSLPSPIVVCVLNCWKVSCIAFSCLPRKNRIHIYIKELNPLINEISDWVKQGLENIMRFILVFSIPKFTTHFDF